LFTDLQYTFNSYYEEYLDAKFPFGSYTQVFLAPEMIVSSTNLGASIGVFSSQVLYDETVIDQVCSLTKFLDLAHFGYPMQIESHEYFLCNLCLNILSEVLFSCLNMGAYLKHKTCIMLIIMLSPTSYLQPCKLILTCLGIIHFDLYPIMLMLNYLCLFFNMILYFLLSMAC
jgi:hypothetical protein